MIYFLYGDDRSKVRAKLREIILSQQKKNPEASYFELDEDTWNEEKLKEFIETQGLFQSKYIIVLNLLLEDKKISEFIISYLDHLRDSANIFIFSEGKVSKDISSKIEKRSEKSQVFSIIKKESKKKEVNVFELTDALGLRDKKKLWVLYQKALLQGVNTEEVHRLLTWQIKSLLSAKQSKSANEAGLNPFVFKKSVGFSKNFDLSELNNLSFNLVTMYHNARRGIIDFDISLEKFILDL